MERILLDTNIFGRIIEKKEAEFILDCIEKSGAIIYGSDVIRKELRNTPKKEIVNYERTISKLRILLLNLYDSIVKRTVQTTAEMRGLAELYFAAYKKLNGSKSREELINDFIIVATATLKGLDIVYSEDDKTMCSNSAIDAYELVNRIKELKMPEFKGYEGFKNDLKKL